MLRGPFISGCSWGKALRLSCIGALGWALFLGPAAKAQEVLDRVVAVIEGVPLTLSELSFETRVLLVERGGVQAEAAILGDETLRDALEWVIAQRLQVREADRLQAFQAESSELNARLERFIERLGGPEALKAFLERQDADLEQLQSVMERSVRAEHILDGRIRLRAQVRESEVRRYYELHASELGGTYEAVRPSLMQKLSRERYAQLAAAELTALKRTAQVRRLAPFAREVAP